MAMPGTMLPMMFIMFPMFSMMTMLVLVSVLSIVALMSSFLARGVDRLTTSYQSIHVALSRTVIAFPGRRWQFGPISYIPQGIHDVEYAPKGESSKNTRHNPTLSHDRSTRSGGGGDHRSRGSCQSLLVESMFLRLHLALCCARFKQWKSNTSTSTMRVSGVWWASEMTDELPQALSLRMVLLRTPWAVYCDTQSSGR